ncbi:MAG: metal ABC transporter substrate-binding protein [Leptolyngbyaceae cyanobacterium]
MIFQSQIPVFLRASLAAIATTSLFIASCSSGPVAESTDPEQPTDAVSASDTEEEGAVETDAADQALVYVANYPLQYFAERIGGDTIQAELPVPGDIDPAFWEPTADELAQLQEADLIILNGATYEKWLETASLPQAKTVDTAEPFSDRWISIKETVTHQHGPEGEHSHEGTAFTTWVDPMLAIEQATVIRDRLSAEFPEQADVFAANFEELEADLVAIDEQIETIITASPQQTQPLIASHPVYDYFAERYGLNLQSVLWEPESFPEEDQWAELEAMLAEHPAEWMIWEGEPLPESVERLQELGIESVVVDPAGNVPETGDFLAVMQANVDNLQSVFAE